MSSEKDKIQPSYLELHARLFLHHRQGQPDVLSFSSEVQARQARCRLQNLLLLPLPLLLLQVHLLMPPELMPVLVLCKNQ